MGVDKKENGKDIKKGRNGKDTKKGEEEGEKKERNYPAKTVPRPHISWGITR